MLYQYPPPSQSREDPSGGERSLIRKPVCSWRPGRIASEDEAPTGAGGGGLNLGGGDTGALREVVLPGGLAAPPAVAAANRDAGADATRPPFFTATGGGGSGGGTGGNGEAMAGAAAAGNWECERPRSTGEREAAVAAAAGGLGASTVPGGTGAAGPAMVLSWGEETGESWSHVVGAGLGMASDEPWGKQGTKKEGAGRREAESASGRRERGRGMASCPVRAPRRGGSPTIPHVTLPPPLSPLSSELSSETGPASFWQRPHQLNIWPQAQRECDQGSILHSPMCDVRGGALGTATVTTWLTLAAYWARAVLLPYIMITPLT